MCAAIALQEPARLLQHLFYFIAHETIPLANSASRQAGVICIRSTYELIDGM